MPTTQHVLSHLSLSHQQSIEKRQWSCTDFLINGSLMSSLGFARFSQLLSSSPFRGEKIDFADGQVRYSRSLASQKSMGIKEKALQYAIILQRKQNGTLLLITYTSHQISHQGFLQAMCYAQQSFATSSEINHLHWPYPTSVTVTTYPWHLMALPLMNHLVLFHLLLLHYLPKNP